MSLMSNCLGNTAAAADGALASSGGPGSLRGQVINLATGANETEAAARAVSMLTQTASADSSSLQSPTTAAAASSSEEVEGRGTEGEEDVAREVAGGDGSSPQSPSSTGTANGVKLDAKQAETKMEKFVENLEGMSPGALVASFRRAQEERVALYKRFNG